MVNMIIDEYKNYFKGAVDKINQYMKVVCMCSINDHGLIIGNVYFDNPWFYVFVDPFRETQNPCSEIGLPSFDQFDGILFDGVSWIAAETVKIKKADYELSMNDFNILSALVAAYVDRTIKIEQHIA